MLNVRPSSMIDADDLIDRLKEQLRRDILRLVDRWDQLVAARRIGIGQPRMSDLRHGRLERFSVERLIRMLATIDHRVDINVVNIGPPRPYMFVPRQRKPTP